MLSREQIERAINEGALPRRWWMLPDIALNNPTINNFLGDYNRNVITCAGRRSFKSEINKRKLAMQAMENPNHRYLIICPILAQSKNVYWSGNLNIVDFFPNFVIKKVSDSELKITLTNNTIIQLGSADTIQRYEGIDINGCLLDEAGDCSNLKEVIERSIMPMLLTTNGWLYISGVPRQNVSADYKELWEKYSDKNKYPEWSCYTWKSEDVLSKKELEKIRATTDPLTYEQEYCGTFHSGYGGKAYYRFDDKLHLKEIPVSDSVPIYVAMDFNTSIMPISLFQILNNDFVNVFDQVVDRHTNLHQVIPKLKSKLVDICGSESSAKSRLIILNGDHTGHNHTIASKGTVWEVVEELFRVDGWNVKVKTKTNPLVDTRISATNARLQSADNNVHMAINPKCSELIQDFKMVGWSDLTRSKEKLEKAERTHASDALSYAIHYYFPLRKTQMYNI